MNQFRCKQLKSTVVLGFKALAIDFCTVTVEKPSLSQRKQLFNYGQQQVSNCRLEKGPTLPGQLLQLTTHDSV